MADIVLLLSGAALVVVGIGLGSSTHYDWLDSGRQKIVEDWGVSPDYRGVSGSFPLNSMNYANVENSQHWAIGPERSRDAYILNAADSHNASLRDAAAYDITINNRRRQTKRYGIRYPYM